MAKLGKSSKFEEKLRAPAENNKQEWAFIVLPKAVSETLPRRGRTTVEGTVNSCEFQATLEPDGQLSHWLKVDKQLLAESNKKVGDTVTIEIKPVEKEPEPKVPDDLKKALTENTAAYTVWQDTTTIARLDWIHWIESGKQAKTRTTRINKTCDMLASGKRRVCCFDQSGYYSKSFSAPKEAK